MHTQAHVKVRGSLTGVSFLLPRGYWDELRWSGLASNHLSVLSLLFHLSEVQVRSCPLNSKTQAPFLQESSRVSALVSSPLPKGPRTFLTPVSSSPTKLSRSEGALQAGALGLLLPLTPFPGLSLIPPVTSCTHWLTRIPPNFEKRGRGIFLSQS